MNLNRWQIGRAEHRDRPSYLIDRSHVLLISVKIRGAEIIVKRTVSMIVPFGLSVKTQIEECCQTGHSHILCEILDTGKRPSLKKMRFSKTEHV